VTEVAKTGGTSWPGRVWNNFCVPFWQRSLKNAAPVLFLIVAAMTLLERTRPFEYLKGTLVDAFTRSNTTEMPDNLVIVEITGDDYKDLFGGKSPLNATVMFQLIRALGPLQPSVVAVDVDTSEAPWACMNPEELKEGNLENTKFVWAQLPLESHGSHMSGEDAAKITLGPVMGGRITDEKQVGLARFPQDEDGYVRGFHSTYSVQGKLPGALPCPSSPDNKKGQASAQTPVVAESPNASESHDIPAFYRAIAETYYSNASKNHSDEKDREFAHPSDELKYLKFTGERRHFQMVDAGHFLTKDNKTGRIVTKSLGADDLSRLQHPMVLIGGAYPEARDEYYTPLGLMPGVELIANAVENELGSSVTEVGMVKRIVFDLFAGVLIVFIYFKNPDGPVRAFALSLAAMALVVAAGAFFYYGIGAFLNFVPVMAGMVIHQMVEGTQQAAELKEQVSELRKEVAGKETEIAHLKSELGEARLEMALGQQGSPVPAATAETTPIIIVETESTTVVETEPEHSPAGKTKKTPRKRGHAAGN
jgi:CHASE2 domain-containing sensor protein